MKSCIEYKGYQIEAEIYDVIGTGVVVTIKPISSLAARVDENAAVTGKENTISMTIDGKSLPREEDEASIIDVGLRAAMIEVDVRLSRSDIVQAS